MHRDFVDVQSIIKDVSGRDLVQMEQEIDDGALATSGGSDNSQSLSLFHVEGDVFQHGQTFRLVGEREVAHLDFTLQLRFRIPVLRNEYFRLSFEDSVDSTPGCLAGMNHVDDPAQGDDGPDQHLVVNGKLHRFSQVKIVSLDYQQTSTPEDENDSDFANEVHEREQASA